MPPVARFGIKNTRNQWWAFDQGRFNRWVEDPIAARWFQSAREAELAALRELPDRRDEWTVQAISVGGSDAF